MNTLRQALRAQRAAVLRASADSPLWAERATWQARRALHVLGDEAFDAALAPFDAAWFESRTWRDQATAFLRLRMRGEYYPHSSVAELTAAFGVPDAH